MTNENLIEARIIDEDLWIRLSDANAMVQRRVDEERAACIEICEEHEDYDRGTFTNHADLIRKRGKSD